MISNVGNTKHLNSRRLTFVVTVKYLENGRFMVAPHAGVMLNGNLLAAIEILQNMFKGIMNMLSHGVAEEQKSQKDLGAYRNKFLCMSAIIIK